MGCGYACCSWIALFDVARICMCLLLCFDVALLFFYGEKTEDMEKDPNYERGGTPSSEDESLASEEEEEDKADGQTDSEEGSPPPRRTSPKKIPSKKIRLEQKGKMLFNSQPVSKLT